MLRNGLHFNKPRSEHTHNDIVEYFGRPEYLTNSFIFRGMSQHTLSIYNAVTFSNNTETIANYHFMHSAFGSCHCRSC